MMIVEPVQRVNASFSYLADAISQLSHYNEIQDLKESFQYDMKNMLTELMTVYRTHEPLMTEIEHQIGESPEDSRDLL